MHKKKYFDKNGRLLTSGCLLLCPDTESEYADVGIGQVKVAETPICIIGKIIGQHGHLYLWVAYKAESISVGKHLLSVVEEEYFSLTECEVIDLQEGETEDSIFGGKSPFK